MKRIKVVHCVMGLALVGPFSPLLKADVTVTSEAEEAHSQQDCAKTVWTKTEREAAPTEYAAYVKRQVEQELCVRRTAEKEVTEKLVRLSEKIREVSKEKESCWARACDLRGKLEENVYPMCVNEQEFPDRDAVVTEISMQLKMHTASEEVVKTLQELKRVTQDRLEELCVEIRDLDSRLVAIDTQIVLMKRNALPGESRQMVLKLERLCPTKQSSQLTQQEKTVQEFLNGKDSHCPTTQVAAPPKQRGLPLTVGKKPLFSQK